MKLNAINNTIVNRQNSNTNKNNNNNNASNNSLNNTICQTKQVSFTGFANAATVFWNFVDMGGRGLQFTVEDMLGTNIPRTYKGAMAGYKYTGEINMSALAQEAIREFLTGPLMTLTPFAVLGLAMKMTGKTADTHKQNIENLSYLASLTDANKEAPEVFERKFVTKTVEDLLQQTTQKTPDKETVTGLTEDILNYSALSKKAKTRAEKKEAKKALGALQSKFETIIKSTRDNFDGIDLQKARFSTYNGKTGTTNFDTYVKYITNYVTDYIKTNSSADNGVDLAEKTIKSFQRTWVGRRILTIISMVAVTGIVLSIIPKLYTLASGKDNPSGKAIYAEAQKRGGSK